MVKLDQLRASWRMKVLSGQGLMTTRTNRIARGERYFEWLTATGKNFKTLSSDEMKELYVHLRTRNAIKHSKSVVRTALEIQLYAADMNAGDANALVAWEWPEEGSTEGRGADERDPTRLSETALMRHFQDVWRVAESPMSAHEKALTLRRLAMAELTYGGALRARDIIELEIASVRSEEAAAGYLVLSKGKAERLVPYTSSARKAVELWIAAAAKAKRSLHRLVFCSLRTKPLDQSTVSAELRAFGTYTEQCGNGVISGFSLRHAFADHLLARGADIRAVGHAMGVKNVRALEPYLPKADAAGEI